MATKKKPALLPEPLRYLQPFANALAKLSPEHLNEVVDSSRLETALRKRLRGLDEEAAESELASGRDLLGQFLKDKPLHPAHWIFGYLLSADLASFLTKDPEPPSRGPEITFEAPDGWTVKKVPFGMDLKAEKVIGTIMASDEFGYEHALRVHEQSPKVNRPDHQPCTWTDYDVIAGDCSGKKFVVVMSGPVPWKRVEYVLRVPGGYMHVLLSSMNGKEYDELPFEAQLHTLRLSPSS